MKLVIGMAAGLVLLMACSSGGGPKSVKSHSVTYQLDGTETGLGYSTRQFATVTARTPSGIEQASDIVLPRTYSFAFPEGAQISISAQAGLDGDVSCTILVDGVQVSHNTSYGGGSIASCDATATS